MTDYRAYQMDLAGHIVSAHELQATTDEAAEALALKLCTPGVPTVELWHGARRVCVLSCGQAAGDRGLERRPSSPRQAGSSAKQAFRQPAGRAVDWLRRCAPQPR